jgi:hypothetical protein
MSTQDKRQESRERLALQDKQLQKIARHYDRLDEKLAELEAMLPQFEPTGPVSHAKRIKKSPSSRKTRRHT